MVRHLVGLASAAALALATTVSAVAAPTPDEASFRDLYKELVETNTSLSVGDCTLAATRMAARLKAAGYPEADVQVWSDPAHPKEGGLFARLPGKDASAKAVLMLAHIDVVEARREDWTRDPFKLVEENGYFYGRGTADMKGQAAIWVDNLIRYRQESYQPRRTIKLALTCGEETAGAFNGAQYLANSKRDLIDAAFALNEGGSGRLSADGKQEFLGFQVGEKLPQDFTLEITNPGGHSSRPVPKNAINQLAVALTRIASYSFPIAFNDTTRGYFTELAKIKGGAEGAAMLALIKNPKDARAAALLVADPNYNSVLHTTCIATMLEAGHATNALPQRARANINCRIFPGTSVEDVRKTLETVAATKELQITLRSTRSAPAPPPPLDPKVIGPAQALAKEMFPGVPTLLAMSSGATDAAFLTPTGIPTYGISGIFSDADGGGVHGLNERIRVKSLMDARTYLYRLIKMYAE